MTNPACGLKADLPGQFDRFVDGGMLGDAIEPEDLVKAQPQQVAQQRLLCARRRLARDQPVQRRLPADDAVGQLLAQVAIRGREPCLGQRRFQPVLDEVPARVLCRTCNAISLGFSPLTAFNRAVPLGGRER